MGVRHKLVSTKPDLGDTSVVRPSDWNATHNAPPTVVTLVGASVTWTNMPAAATEFTGTPRTKYDLTHADDVRLVVRVGAASSTNATLRVQYSTDESAWSNLTAAVNVGTTGTKVSAWEAVAAGAKGDVYLRVLGESADGAADPQFRLVQLQVR